MRLHIVQQRVWSALVLVWTVVVVGPLFVGLTRWLTKR